MNCPRKIMNADTETTGTDPSIHNIWQFSGRIHCPGKDVHEFNYKMRPFSMEHISEDALKVGKVTKEELAEFMPSKQAFEEISAIIKTYVDPYDKTDKMVFSGYQGNFDAKFARKFWFHHGDKFYGSLFEPYVYDGYGLARILRFYGIIPTTQNLKLTSVCEFFGIDLGEGAHDALADVIAYEKFIEICEDRYFNFTGDKKECNDTAFSEIK